MGPRCGLDKVRRRKDFVPSRDRTPVFQSVGARFTDVFRPKFHIFLLKYVTTQNNVRTPGVKIASASEVRTVAMLLFNDDKKLRRSRLRWLPVE